MLRSSNKKTEKVSILTQTHTFTLIFKHYILHYLPIKDYNKILWKKEELKKTDIQINRNY